jgi:hypothetical protein
MNCIDVTGDLAILLQLTGGLSLAEVGHAGPSKFSMTLS